MTSRKTRVAGVVCALMVGVLGAACGSGSDSTWSGAASGSASGSASGGSSQGASAAVAEAKATVAKLSGPQTFEVEPLSSKPPEGLRIADVNCAIPQCSPGLMEEPAKVLGWDYQRFDFDATKGVQDLVRAFDDALDSKPDFLAVNVGYGLDIIARQLERANAEGIPVIGLAGDKNTDGLAVSIQSQFVTEQAGSYMADVALADKGGSVHV